MLADRLSKAWEAQRRSSSIDAVMRFSEEGLVFGAGTVLARSGASGRDISIDPLEPRLAALLVSAHLRRPPPRSLAHLRKAAECWRHGEDALAAMHLALSRIDRLMQPDVDAHRMFLADGLLAGGVDAAAIIGALESGASDLDQVLKYDPSQPRVAAGSGRTSGEWTATGNGPAAPSSPQSRVGPSAIASVAYPYRGDDACDRAKRDCYRHAMEPSVWSGSANDNWQINDTDKCRFASWTCEAVAFAVEQTPFFRRGGVLFPDKGIVIADKGEELLYIPAESGARVPPFRRAL
jgi:hypothetical protein